MRSWSMTIVLAIALLVPQYALTWNGQEQMPVRSIQRMIAADPGVV